MLAIFFAGLLSVCYGQLIVNTQYGMVQGRVLGAGVANGWLGVPFGHAARFSAPQAPQSWSGVRSTISFGPGCPQHCVLPDGLCPESQSEDCLNLNIYAPTAPSSNRVPVLAFIYGGAFAMGVSGCKAYDARYLANATGAIVVTFNYRLGVLGFLISGSSNGNYGILDQRFALQWIQHNIANFGGDPSQVTLFGQSAGAMSTTFHLLDKASWGLYQRAIVQSNPLALPFLTKETGEIFTRKAAQAIGCDPDDLTCFANCRGACLETLLTAQDQGAGEQIWHPFASFLATTPMAGPGSPINNPFEMLTGGLANPDAPIVFSACSQDAVMFMDQAFPDGTISFVDYIALITDVWGAENVPPITSRYPSLTSSSERLTNLENLATDYLFVCSGKKVASMQSFSNTHTFIFNHVLSFGSHAWGQNYSFCFDKVCHGAELVFQFGSAGLNNFTMTSAERRLQQDMMQFMQNYAFNGNPNNDQLLQAGWWPPSQSGSYIFATPSSVTSDYDSMCPFWDSVGYSHAGNFVKALAKRRAANKKK